MDILTILSILLPMDPLTILIIGVSGIIIGGLITGTILRKAMDRKRDMILKEAMEKAEMIKRDKILQAKEKFLQLKSEHEKYIHEKNDEVQKNENRLKQKETVFNQKTEGYHPAKPSDSDGSCEQETAGSRKEPENPD